MTLPEIKDALHGYEPGMRFKCTFVVTNSELGEPWRFTRICEFVDIIGAPSFKLQFYTDIKRLGGLRLLTVSAKFVEQIQRLC